jgi:hypothetical protein
MQGKSSVAFILYSARENWSLTDLLKSLDLKDVQMSKSRNLSCDLNQSNGYFHPFSNLKQKYLGGGCTRQRPGP